MLIRCGLLMLFLSCVKTIEEIHDGTDGVSEFNRRFSLWPSVLNAARLMRVRRDNAQIIPNGISEGINLAPVPPLPTTTTQAPQQAAQIATTNDELKHQLATNLRPSGINPGLTDGQLGANDAPTVATDANIKSESNVGKPGGNNANPGETGAKPIVTNAKTGETNAKPGETDAKSGETDAKPSETDAKPGETNAKPGATDAKASETDAKAGTNDTKSGTPEVNPAKSNVTATSPSSVITGSKLSPVLNATDNSTIAVKPTKAFDLNDPGVVKRGFIVFGGFALLAVAYYIFYYRRKGKSNSSGNTHSLTDTNQFRYGVLQSEDKRDTELSRVPLTMESDDDEEEDMEIFDLEQKKKSLSYVNLQTNDEDVVFSLNDQEDDRGNLLLDIEDGTSDTLINWSSTGNNKSIL